jgi:hypothetical protein
MPPMTPTSTHGKMVHNVLLSDDVDVDVPLPVKKSVWQSALASLWCAAERPIMVPARANAPMVTIMCSVVYRRKIMGLSLKIEDVGEH